MELSTPASLELLARAFAEQLGADRTEKDGDLGRVRIVYADGRALDLPSPNRPRTRITVTAVLPEQASAHGIEVKPITVTAQPRPRPSETRPRPPPGTPPTTSDSGCCLRTPEPWPSCASTPAPQMASSSALTPPWPDSLTQRSSREGRTGRRPPPSPPPCRWASTSPTPHPLTNHPAAERAS